MQLYFIRHAQSENNAHFGDDNYQESHDPLLTKLAYYDRITDIFAKKSILRN